MDLKKNDVEILSFPFLPIKSIRNNGRIHFNLKGPLDNLTLRSKALDLNQFELVFNENTSFFDSRLMIDNDQLYVKDGVVYFDSVQLSWQGADTFRRVTRTQKKNKFNLKGSMTFNEIDLFKLKRLGVMYDFQIAPSFFSVNFPAIYSGDILSSELNFVGQQMYLLSNLGRKDVLSTLGTNNEVGPTLNGSVSLRDGIFNFPKLGVAR